MNGDYNAYKRSGARAGSGLLFMIISILLLIFGVAMFCLSAIFFLIGKASLGDERSIFQIFILLVCGFTAVTVGTVGLSANENLEKANVAVQFGCASVITFILNFLLSFIKNNYIASVKSLVGSNNYFSVLISVLLNIVLPLGLPILYYIAASKNKKSLS